MKKKIVAIILICVAVVSLALGIVSMTKISGHFYTGKYVSRQTYGGDAYTGIQNAAADTAWNVEAGNEILNKIYDAVCFGFGALLLVIGLALIGVGVCCLLKKEEEPAKQSTEEKATGFAPQE